MTRNKNTAVVSRAAVQETVSAALRSRIGPGALTYAEVADAIDADPRAVKGWVLGDCTPRMAEFVRLCAYLGPEFASETLAPAGLKARSVEANDVCAFELTADVAGLCAQLAEALRDGWVDHREAAVLVPLARQTITRLSGWVQAQTQQKLKAVS